MKTRFHRLISGAVVVTLGVALQATTVSGKLLNVNFGGGPAEAKSGPAAVGQTASDFWNFYSRDDGAGGYRPSGSLTDLKWADESSSTVDLAVENAAGAWPSGVSDPMMAIYLYPLPNGNGNIGLTLSQVPVGHYDLYLYGRGNLDQLNGVFAVTASGQSFGPTALTVGPGWQTLPFQEDVHYVVFRDVPSDGTSPISISVQPSAHGEAVLNGLQLVQTDSIPPLPAGRLLVVPNSFAEREDDGYSGSLGSAMRLQCVYGSAHFGSKRLLIKAAMYRREPSVPPSSGSHMNAEIRLSTTPKSPDALSAVFAENTGPDEKLVASGIVTLASNSEPQPGTAMPFDIVIPFGQPFEFDPAKGNLLFDITTRVPSAIAWVDASNEGGDDASRAFSFIPDSATAGTVDTGADIIGFVVEEIGAPPVNQAVLPPAFAKKEGAGYTGPLGTPMRLQNVYAASHFSGPITIREIRYRRDGGLGPLPASDINLRVRLSTTSKAPDALSSTFEENLGADAALVLDGAVTVSSPSEGVAGGPQPFEVLLPLTTPFAYDPAKGNLLVEITSRTASLVKWTDGSNDGDDRASRVFSYNLESAQAEYVDTGADIIMLSAVVEQPPALEITPAGGYFTGTVAVTLRSTVEGGEVRYTLDDTEPTVSSSRYEQPLSLTTSARVKARVFKSGEPASDIVSALYLESHWNDGIPAAWREQYFGGNWFTKPEALALADADNDGATTYQEWLSQTSPTDANSKRTWPVASSIYAGSTRGYQDGPRLEAQFDGGIADMAFDAQGRLWLLEASAVDYTTPGPSGHRIRRIETDGTVVTVAGAEAGFVDGPAAQARFSIPQGLAFGPDGSVYIADRGNNRIRKLDPAGNVTTLAGSAQGYQDGSVANALFGLPMGIASDTAGNLFVADFWNLRIRQIAPDGTVSTYANLAGNRGRQDGPRLDASFDVPNDVAFGPDGSLFVSDWPNQAVRKITPEGMVTTVGRSQGWMERVSVDAGGNVYTASALNDHAVLFLEKITPAGESVWLLNTYDLVTRFGFEGVSRVIELPGGDLLVGDLYRVRRLQMAAAPLLSLAPLSGEYELSAKVIATSSLPSGQGEVRYTDDGREPTAASPLFPSEFVLTKSATIKAGVFVNGNPVSAVVSQMYTIKDAPPTISMHPLDRNVFENSTVVFTVQATGTAPLSYQWMFGGADIVGATDQELRLVAVTAAHAGSYSVRVSNALGSAVSQPAVLTVAPRPERPTIVKQPQPISIAVGQAATFTVEATGTEPLQYLWFRNGIRIFNAPSTPTYTIASAKLSDAGSFSVRISNPQGSVGSAIARLTVTAAPEPPSITQVPEGSSWLEGSYRVLKVAATGTSPLAYQWYFNGSPIAGATGTELALPALKLSDAGTYGIVVSNAAGSDTVVTVLDVFPATPGGTVNFANKAEGVDAPVFDSDGVTRLAGADYLAQLWAGQVGSTLAPVGAAVPFRTGIGAGYFLSGWRTLTSVAPGESADCQVRVWETAFGPTYEQAASAGGKVGSSTPVVVITGGAGEPPGLPPALTGLQSFRVGAETAPPTIVIESPLPGTTSDERVTLAGSVTDNGIVASAAWEWNGHPMGTLAPVQGRFSVTGLRLLAGENRLRVTASDAAGNSASAEVVVTWQPLRVFGSVDMGATQEGRRFDLPVSLNSGGDVGGLSFELRYDLEQLRDPQVTFGEAVAGGLAEVNTDTPGVVRVTLSKPGVGIPAGEQALAVASFRARSVSETTRAEVAVRLLDHADDRGNVILFGTAVLPGSVVIHPRKFIGDNNGNDRLDIGDATVIQRFVALLDPLRSWDVPANDLNQTTSLDSGDVIRVLRTVVGLDPQPTLPPGGRSAGLAGAESGNYGGQISLPPPFVFPPGLPTAVVRTESPRALPGDQITVRVELQGVPIRIFGATFTLNYPAAALRLIESGGYRTGAMVPAGALSLWNPIPAEGRISAAVMASEGWVQTSYVAAEFTFEVLAGATASTSWAVTATNAEVTGQDGLNVIPLAGSSLEVGALPVLGPTIGFETDGRFKLTFRGRLGGTYAIEASNDLSVWQRLDTIYTTGETQAWADNTASGVGARFYRLRQIQ